MPARTTLSLMAICCVATIGLTGCGSSAERYQPLVDGSKGSHYSADLNACQTLSQQRSYLNDEVKSEMLLGAAIGGAVGAAEEGAEGALAGALVGGLLHGLGRSWEVREERKEVIVECMQQRGHAVVG